MPFPASGRLVGPARASALRTDRTRACVMHALRPKARRRGLRWPDYNQRARSTLSGGSRSTPIGTIHPGATAMPWRERAQELRAGAVRAVQEGRPDDALALLRQGSALGHRKGNLIAAQFDMEM